jgi:soluble lytic murein transglycosylase-like protein
MNVKLLRAEWRAVRRVSMRLTQQSLSMVGLLAVAVTALVATHPEYAHAVGHWIVPATPAAPVNAVALPDPLAGAIANSGSEASRMLGLNAAESLDTSPVAASDARVAVSDNAGTPREKHDAVSYLSKKYRVNTEALSMLVDAAYVTGRELNLDPLLLLSVMAVESGFNPFAESTAGASGLMQLMSKVHADKLADFGGHNIVLNPVVNLRVGAVVLKDCIRRGGSVADGLRLYVGAGNASDDSGYGTRVLQEKDRLAQAVRGVSRPRIEPIPSAPKLRTHQPDIDHSFDNVDPSDPKIQATGSVAAL